MIGMLAGLGVNLYLRFATPVAWTWYVLIGTVTTVAVSLAASAVLDREEAR
jgi:urea transporter